MKTVFLFLGFLLLIVTNTNAQWSQYPTGVPYSLFAVDFFEGDPNIGVAVGQGGTVLRTTDAGVEWTLVSNNLPPFNPNVWLNDVKFIDANYIYAAGMGGVIIKSSDKGITWVSVRSYDNPEHTIRGIGWDPTGGGTVHFVGYAGTYFTYTGAGVLSERTDIQWTMHSIAFAPDVAANGRGIISGTDGLVWNTVNHGVNWASRSSARFEYLNDVVFIDDTEAWIVGNNNVILVTHDWGETWTLNSTVLANQHLRSIDKNFTGPKYNITICGDIGRIYTTTDWGVTWINGSPSGETRHFYGVCLNGTSFGTAVGEVGSWAGGTGMMYNIFDNGTVGVSQTGTTVPQKYSLNQNFPNPFNPTTKISFALAKSGPVMLTVFDLTGKEVAALVNTTLSAGNFEYEFDGSKLSSGVYFYRIITNDFVDTKKMSLLK